MEAIQILNVQIETWKKDARKLNIFYNWNIQDAIRFLDDEYDYIWMPGAEPTENNIKKLVNRFEDWCHKNAENVHWSETIYTSGHDTAQMTWWRAAERKSGMQAAKNQPQPNWAWMFPDYFDDMSEEMYHATKVEGENWEGYKFSPPTEEK